MNVRQIKSLLKKHHIAPLKSLGQHFLINESSIGQIIHIAHITKYDTIVEVGAGFGVLTEKLAKRAKEVIAVEIDKGFVQILTEKFQHFPNVHIAHEDILRYTLHVTRYKLLGNLPYNLTAKILEKFLQREKVKPTMMLIMVQKEFAERMLAKPPEMNRLALLCQYYGKSQIIEHIPPHFFWPQPKVWSSLVTIEVKSQDELPLTNIQEKKMWNMIKHAFSQPRKKLKNSLQIHIAGLQDKRPQELTMEEWVKLITSNE